MKWFAIVWLVGLCSVAVGGQHQQREQFDAMLDDNFELIVTDHFKVYYDQRKPWATQQAALLERTHDVFYSTFNKAKWPLDALTKPLVCVLFDRQRDFATYARNTDNVQSHWPSGYYSSRTNRIAFFNDLGGTTLGQHVTKINRAQANMVVLYSKLRHKPRRSYPREHDGLQRQITSLEKQLDAARKQLPIIARKVSASKTVHEAVHQLAFNSGLQKRGRAYPFWVSEGLATNFEPVDVNQPFGPRHANAGRRKAFLMLRDAGTFMPLDSFIVMLRPPSNVAGEVSGWYGQAREFFLFMWVNHRTALRDYFTALGDIEPTDEGKADTDAMRRGFVAAFGDVAAIDTRWKQYVGQLK